MNISKLESDPMAFFGAVVIPSAYGARRLGEIMQPFQRERFEKISPSLIALARGEKPPIGKFWFEAVKGSSKTSDLALIVLWVLAFSKYQLLAQIGVSDADQAGESLKATAGILTLNPWLDRALSVQASKIISRRSGSVCEILSADVAGSHGARPHLLILDELAHVQRTEFLENLLDNASKMPNGLVVVLTNAGHLKTWAWRLRELARQSSRWLFDQRTEPSPWLDQEEIEEARRRNTPTRFNRLWRGIWSPGGGDALDPDDLAACVIGSGPLPWPRPTCSYVAGLDLSSTRDHSAMVLLEADPTAQKIRVADCRSWAPVAGKIDMLGVRQTVCDVARRFGATVRYDPHESSLLTQDLGMAGVHCEPVPFVASNLNAMASALLQTVREHRIELYPDERLLDDLQKLNIVERSFGFRLEAIRDEHGHCDRGIALAIALPGALAALRDGGIIDAYSGPPIEMDGSILGTPVFPRGSTGDTSPDLRQPGSGAAPGIFFTPLGR